MARAQRSTTHVVDHITATLKGSKPPIWRCIHVTSETTYGAPGLLGELDVEDARTVPLETLVPRETCKCLYEDEVGERWEHERLVDKRLPLQEGQRYSVGLTGKRARPPEGGGGIWGYAGVLEAIRAPEHPEHDAMVAWVGVNVFRTLFIWTRGMGNSNAS